MDLKRSEEQQFIIDNVRRLIREEIRPLEEEIDPDGYTLKPEDDARLRQMVRDMGLYQMDIPTEYGGPGVDLVTQTMVAEEKTQHRAGLYSPAYGVFGSGPQGQLYSASDYLKEKYLYPNHFFQLILVLPNGLVAMLLI